MITSPRLDLSVVVTFTFAIANADIARNVPTNTCRILTLRNLMNIADVLVLMIGYQIKPDWFCTI